MAAVKECYHIHLTRPEGLERADMRDYIEEAVRTMSGSFEADDRRRCISDHPIKVTNGHSMVKKNW